MHRVLTLTKAELPNGKTCIKGALSGVGVIVHRDGADATTWGLYLDVPAKPARRARFPHSAPFGQGGQRLSVSRTKQAAAAPTAPFDDDLSDILPLRGEL